jgi:hypothetical protein
MPAGLGGACFEELALARGARFMSLLMSSRQGACVEELASSSSRKKLVGKSAGQVCRESLPG